MKRLICLLLAVLCIGCFGCGKDAKQDATASPSPTAAPTSAQIETDTIAIRTAAPDQPLPTPVPTPAPTAAPTDTPAPEPTSIPPKFAAADGVYTIAWISDPQHYSEKFPDSYYAMTAFLRDHAEEMNLTYIIHTGDFVNHPDSDAEWAVADTAQKMIDGIPNGVLAGNHDVLDPVGYTAFCRYFGENRYKNNPWYGGSFENNRGHYDLITVGETAYVFVYMGFGPDANAIRWAKDVFDRYPDRVGVLCLHDYLHQTAEALRRRQEVV
jgi:DNA repair exonuclease